jgi:hypothetical protein
MAMACRSSASGGCSPAHLLVACPPACLPARPSARPPACLPACLQLASFQGGVDSKTSPAAEATPLPPEQMRPAGPITLAGVRHSYLWLADCLGRPFLLSLRHPGLRLRCLAARGEITTARTIAERGASAAAAACPHCCPTLPARLPAISCWPASAAPGWLWGLLYAAVLPQSVPHSLPTPCLAWLPALPYCRPERWVP